ncbi:hypothetical protein M427DRAFT_72109 [Gonapodya prolifera JEL478]|uniref:Uncharacterized protein n=1 Tax=Gonapodya prolifera (strain JEL478) TaxID=1344416 RepID=A0A139A665_GONPJ|nr:hypothetical protein M427DRAFT_72109 [Gonapodya prolifera JEL478]|eukprot:KXS12296.1 hypothetical protein M427DRAFT_72109 [Gonapodya prolifera JEL478]
MSPDFQSPHSHNTLLPFLDGISFSATSVLLGDVGDPLSWWGGPDLESSVDTPYSANTSLDAPVEDEASWDDWLPPLPMSDGQQAEADMDQPIEDTSEVQAGAPPRKKRRKNHAHPPPTLTPLPPRLPTLAPHPLLISLPRPHARPSPLLEHLAHRSLVTGPKADAISIVASSRARKRSASLRPLVAQLMSLDVVQALESRMSGREGGQGVELGYTRHQSFAKRGGEAGEGPAATESASSDEAMDEDSTTRDATYFHLRTSRALLLSSLRRSIRASSRSGVPRSIRGGRRRGKDKGRVKSEEVEKMVRRTVWLEGVGEDD